MKILNVLQEKHIEAQVTLLNDILANAVLHGASNGQSSGCNAETLLNSVNRYLAFEEIDDLYIAQLQNKNTFVQIVRKQ